MNYEKKYKKYVDDNLEVKDQYEEIASKLDFKEERKLGLSFMNKKMVFAVAAACTVVVVGAGIGIGLGVKNSKPVATSYMKMDVNPSISFVLDQKNKVISVSGENDEGKMIIYGESFIGKSAEDAIKLAIQIENETGYLVSGNADVSLNNINISITTYDENIKTSLENSINNAIIEVCDELNIDEKINMAKEYTKDEIEKMAMACDPTLTQEQADNMTYQELFAVISYYHVEVAEFYSEEIEDLYNQAKEYEIKFAESKFTKDTISEIGIIYQAAMNLYEAAMNQLQSATNSLNDMRYEYFIDEASTYQTYLASFKEAKEEVIELRNEIAAKDANSLELNVLQSTLALKEEALNTCISTLEAYKETCVASIDSSIETINTIMETLDGYVAALPDQATVESTLTSKAADLEKYLNSTKDSFFTSFEEEYSDDIQKAKDSVTEYKASLKETVEAAKNK